MPCVVFQLLPLSQPQQTLIVLSEKAVNSLNTMHIQYIAYIEVKVAVILSYVLEIQPQAFLQL